MMMHRLIIRPTSPDSVVMFQRPASYLLRFRRWISPKLSWRCSSGRPRTTWLHHPSSDTGIYIHMSLTDRFSPAQNRSQWMAVATAAKATRIWLTNLFTDRRYFFPSSFHSAYYQQFNMLKDTEQTLCFLNFILYFRAVHLLETWSHSSFLEFGA